ncbi:MAG: NADH-quinone oxidoreductase subunit D [Paracoccaceae bacterium]
MMDGNGNDARGFHDAETGEQKIRNFNINFGPQHPAAHGVLRLVLSRRRDRRARRPAYRPSPPRHRKADGEPHLPTEHPLFRPARLRRADEPEHAFCLAIEKLTGTKVPRRASLIRVLYMEIGRILNHLLNVMSLTIDVGALSPPLWGYVQREKLMEFYDRACGARLHANYIRPGGVHQDLPANLLDDIEAWAHEFPKFLDDFDAIITENRIFKQRTVDIGIVTEDDINTWGLTGVMVRGSGFAWDLRRAEPYELYDEFDFAIPVGTHGDTYDRNNVRMAEMRESTKIILQAVDKLRAPDGQGDVLSRGKIAPPKRGEMKSSMEALIHHFKLYTEGFHVPAGETYTAVEAPKGEFGVYLVADGTNRPYRCKIRAPGYAHLQSLIQIAKGHQLADVAALVGTIDIVFGEIDR